jgi:adenylate kinase family enzyme
MELHDFPVFKTKIDGVAQRFDLNSPQGRQEYFQAKAGPEIAKLKKYLETKTFVAFLLGKKNSGKGTYTKQFMEAVGKDHVGHVSVGDIVRDSHQIFETGEGKTELLAFLEKNYRGFHGVHEIEDIVLGKSQDKLLSSELIIALVKYEISKRPKQAIFIDGFPRALDQIGYSIYLKELLGYREDPDFFVFIGVPNAIIDERIKYRVICPVCKTPRSTKLLATHEVGWDEDTEQFYLKCDNPNCTAMGTRMVGKEGDELGIEPIRDRIELDNQVFRQLLKLEGVPHIYLRNSVPVDVAAEMTDEYELTPEYHYRRDPATGKIETLEKPWTIKDEAGVESYSLLPSAVALSLIKQTARTLGL